MRHLQFARYVAPLREGGSMPALAAAGDGELYVVKFRGAGQGHRALISDLLGAAVARVLGLATPDVALIELDPDFARVEPDPEIQDLLRASAGINLGVRYLSGALTYEPVAAPIDPLLASKIVWLDCFLANIDRTARNANLLWWEGELWLIDHGAALYFHHGGARWEEAASKPMPMVEAHVLLPQASELSAAHAVCAAALAAVSWPSVVAEIPASWLGDVSAFPTIDAHRAAYAAFLTARLTHAGALVADAHAARSRLLATSKDGA